MWIYRKKQNITIIALVVAIVSLGIGFAAFSTTLNISSSASVSPNRNDFIIAFSVYDDSYDLNVDQLDLFGVESGGAIADDSRTTVSGGLVSDLKAIFSSFGQSVTYKFYVHNAGQYDAYLRGVTYTALDNGNYKKCSASTSDSTKATDSLVQAACEGIRITISIGGTTYEVGSTNISGHILPKGGVEEVIFKMEYVDGASLADGPFNVEFSNFKFDYSTVDND